MTTTKLLLTLITTFSISVFAQQQQPVLLCATNGQGIAHLKVLDSGDGKGVIKIVYSEADEDEAPVETYSIVAGLHDLKNGTSSTLIANQPNPNEQDNGNIYDDAVLLRVVDGQNRGFVAVKGTVYKLLCFK